MDSLQRAEAENSKLRRRLQRERAARLEAESIAEEGLRRLFAKNQQLLLLEAIADAANQAVSVADALASAVRSVCQFTVWQVGHAYVVAGDGSEARLLSTSIWQGVQEKHLRDFSQSAEAADFDSGAGLPGRVLAGAAPAWIPDIALDPDFPRAAAAERIGLKSAAAFPVLMGDEVTAVLEFFADRVLEPDETLLRLMARIGTQLGRVAERNRAENRLLHDAFHDRLTGLPNRSLFADRLAHAVAHHRRQRDDTFAVLFIDLDDFKRVNDSLGHRAGDDLIVQLAVRLKACLREEDTLARIGGDEFTVLLEGAADVNDAKCAAERLMAALRQPFTIDNEEVFAGASIGITAGTAGHESADELLQHADLAMYRAKALGKGRYEIYDPAAHERSAGGVPPETWLAPRAT
ncbi:sensor domain-containing diguanylate cyclase [Arthrobacter sp. CG_A4]|uniref:sensor domain-containing diguanylate cyclase n=1 Tax=Arthrobacter sp. CG_A4 TaxID=3071706 RepID=UPI002DFEF380|nr:diguanylate cyclase (GGDEF)-like protein [Arthrobacter sp. CG_A4]